MSNELTVVEQNPIAEIEKTNMIMGSLMKLPHYQKMGVETVFAIVAKARSLGIDPMYALNGGLYAIKGKIGMPAEAMAAMIRERGHSITRDKASTDTCCILNGKRKDNGDTWTCKFSIDDAKKAGIYVNSWEKYGSAMCYNRAMSFLARQLFPDVIKGAGYTMEELKEIATSNSSSYMETVEMVEVEPEKINSDQATLLKKVLSDCSDEYQASVMTTLRKASKPVESIDALPTSLYDRILMAAMKKKDEYQAVLVQKEMDNVLKEEE